MKKEFKDWWWLNEESESMLERGYLLKGQTVEDKIDKICKHAASILKDDSKVEKFKDIFVKGYASLSSPIWANFGEDRALPISCFSSYVKDSLDGIYDTLKEVAMMTKGGGGTSGYFNLRPSGASVSGGATSSGAMSFIKLFDSTIEVVKQNNVRRGAFAAYMDIEHEEIMDLLKVKDKGNEMQTINTAVCVSDEWMKDMIGGDSQKRTVWAEVLKSRREKGIPYLFFKDNVNNNKPQVYKNKQLTIWQSNLCLSGDQRVVTDRGYLTAKTLYEQGGGLILHNGEKEVLSSEMRLIETGAKVYRITLENGIEHKVTEYHGIPVRGDRGVITRVACKDLKKGDKVAIQTKKGLFGKKSMKDEAFLLGLYQSDGAQTEKDLMLDIWENDFDILEEVQESFNIVHKKYGCETYDVINQTGNVVGKRNRKPDTFHDCKVSNGDVKKKRLTSRTLKKALNFEKGYVPEWIFESDEQTQWQYIRGLLIADGTAFKSKSKGEPLQISYADINKEFLKDLQLIFNNLGLQSSIRLLREAGSSVLPDGKGGTKEYNTKTCYRLIISSKTAALEVEKNTRFLTRKNVKLENKKYRDNTKKSYKVLSIDYVGKEDVYCPTVSNKEHIFISQGMKTFNCNEIYLPTSEDESLVCCLLSMNLYTYDDWKDTDAVELMIEFLDAVMEDFIRKASKMNGFERAVKFAKNHRALGLGVLGWHSYLQKNMVPFESFKAQQLNTSIFKNIQEKAIKSSQKLARIYGEPELLKGYGLRNTTLLALAPTTSSSSILGQVSPTIEPLKSNYFVVGLAKGSFTRKNNELRNLLVSLGKSNEDVWKSISLNKGSVQHLDFLSEEEKEVFKTFAEISPMTIIQQASARGKYICQGQSINLMIPQEMSIKDINKIHIEAWELGLKGLYYQRGSSVAKDAVLKMMSCSSCEG